MLHLMAGARVSPPADEQDSDAQGAALIQKKEHGITQAQRSSAHTQLAPSHLATAAASAAHHQSCAARTGAGEEGEAEEEGQREEGEKAEEAIVRRRLYSPVQALDGEGFPRRSSFGLSPAQGEENEAADSLADAERLAEIRRKLDKEQKWVEKMFHMGGADKSKKTRRQAPSVDAEAGLDI